MALNERRNVKELLSEMSTSEKARYLWEYYRYYLFGFIIVVAVVVFIVAEQSGKKESALTILVLADSVNSTEVETIKQKLDEEILTEEERETHELSIQVIPYSSNTADATTVQAALQRVAAEISVKDLDILFIDKNQFEIMNREQYFYNLNELMNENIPIDEEYAFYNTNQQVVGIAASEVPLFNQAIGSSDVIMGVIGNTQRKDKTKELLNILFEK